MTRREPYRYCPYCGDPLIVKEMAARPVPYCLACRRPFFQDPKVAAAVLVVQRDRVLLVRRGVDPQRGQWALPAGFVDAGEDPRRAAQRECLEETGLQVKITGLLDVVFGGDEPRGASIIIVYCAQVRGGDLRPADDVDEARFFPLDRLPPLAFRASRLALARWRLGKGRGQ